MSAFPHRRQHRRVRARVPVRFGETTLDRQCIADTLSVAGLHLNTNRVLPTGTRLWLELGFPDGNRAVLRGEVVWSIEVPDHLRTELVYGMGVRFLQTGSDWEALFETWKRTNVDGDR